MPLKNSLVTKLAVSLTITPQLQQILKFLQLNNLDFVEELKKILEENPVVELEHEKEEADEEHLSWGGYFSGVHDFSRNSAGWNLDSFSLNRTLEEELEEQVRLLKVDSKTQEILMWIIWNLDDDGFFRSSNEEVCAKLGVSQEEFESARALCKHLEPCGVGARDFFECLLWQLELRGFSENSVPRRLLTHCLSLLVKGRFEQIQRKLGISAKELKNALKLIRSLNPRPAFQFKHTTPPGLPVDLILEINGGDLNVYLNKSFIPKIKITKELENCSDPTFRKILRNLKNSAKTLSKIQNQRESSLVRIAKQIIEEQKEFFLSFGSAALKPLTLKQVAEKLNVHESTVSRATANKYIATPFGLFELKKFFSSKISQENISSEYVKNRVQEFIVQEDKTSPLSDSEIAHLIFQKYGVKVARRTVAKYREALKIAPAQQRKCHYQINL